MISGKGKMCLTDMLLSMHLLFGERVKYLQRWGDVIVTGNQ